ncbi:MAG TPA: hypothetical protein ENK61_05970 [Devosia sp.]|nr:hypothetical protein [Devosia sp.]
MTNIFLAVTIGLAFGVALNRIGATNPQNLINMMRLKDLHLLKTIVFSIGLSSFLLFGGMTLGLIDPGHLSVKSAYVGVLLGGAIFGTGFAIAGYCPGTSLSAAATGRKDALFFVAGGLLGALAYMLSYGWISTTFLMDKIGGGKVTVAMTENDKFGALFTSVNGPLMAAILGIVFMTVAWFAPANILKKSSD